MSWKYHSEYLAGQIQREYNDVLARPMMSYRFVYGISIVHAKNLDGIKKKARELVESIKAHPELKRINDESRNAAVPYEKEGKE